MRVSLLKCRLNLKLIAAGYPAVGVDRSPFGYVIQDLR
jgi:hypothetical protein